MLRANMQDERITEIVASFNRVCLGDETNHIVNALEWEVFGAKETHPWQVGLSYETYRKVPKTIATLRSIGVVVGHEQFGRHGSRGCWMALNIKLRRENPALCVKAMVLVAYELCSLLKEETCAE